MSCLKPHHYDSGIDAIGEVTEGTCLGHFYQIRRELIEIVAPFFQAGLKHHEKCVWIVLTSSDDTEMERQLQNELGHIPPKQQEERLQVIHADFGKMSLDSSPNGSSPTAWLRDVLKLEENQAEGVRLGIVFDEGGRTPEHITEDWLEAICTLRENRPVLTLCSYDLDVFDRLDTYCLISAHHYALLKSGSQWKKVKPLHHSRMVQDTGCPEDTDELAKANRRLKESIKTARRMAREAMEANRTKSQFLANMSHEIRTPINGVLSMIDLALEESDDRKKAEYLAAAQSSAHNLLTVINDILDISKIEAGKLEIEIVESSLPQLLAGLETLMAPQAAEKELTFSIKLTTPMPPKIYTDPIRLNQCLINLIGNAIKFTNTGHVQVRAAVDNRPDRPYLRFDVVDTGIGIFPQKLNMIFDTYIQADGSTTRKFGGTGLGLTITKKLAELLGGSVTVESQVDSGSTFSLFIPVRTDLTPQDYISRLDKQGSFARPSPPQTWPVLTGRRILIVEDDLVNRKGLQAFLQKFGVEVAVAVDGLQALDKVSSDPFDLIFMDIQMPNLDGYETTQTLRARGYTRPIVALTAHAMKGDARKCLQAGCDEYLAKPVDRQKLNEVLSRYLSEEQSPNASDPLSLKRHLDEACSETHRLIEMIEQVTTSPDHSTSDYQRDSRPVIDWADLKNRFSNEDIIREVVNSFWVDNPARLRTLEQAVKVEDLKAIKENAHALKGSSATIGAAALYRQVQTLDQAAHEQNMEVMGDLFARVQKEYDRLHAFLSEPNWLEQMKAEMK